MKTAMSFFIGTALIVCCSSAHAAVFQVNTTSDTTNGGGLLSFRQAILDANANPGEDLIQFSVTGTIRLGTNLPPISDGVRIVGPGAGALTLSGHSNQFRLLVFLNTSTSLISGLTIADGRNSSGGGIANFGSLGVEGCVVSNNFASGGIGGGVFNAGSLWVAGSTLCNNVAEGPAGADGGMAFSDGSRGGGGGGGAGLGGGLYQVGGGAELTNTTISGNEARGGKGGAGSIQIPPIGGGGNGGGAFGGIGGYFSVGSGSFGQNGGNGGYASGGGGGGGCNAGCVMPWPSCTNACNGGSGGDGGFGGGGGGGGSAAEFPPGIGRGGRGGSGGTLGGTGDPGGIWTGGFGGGGAGMGGGIFVESGGATVVNCTVAFNHAHGYGAPFTNFFVGDAAGAGVYNRNGEVEIANCLLAQNTGRTRMNPSGRERIDLYGGFISLGHNLLQTTNNSSGFGVTDKVLTNLSLNPLGDNGGGTPTHALQPYHPAVDAADTELAPTVDQRGVGRASGLADIGAFELGLDLTVLSSPGGMAAAMPQLPQYTLGSNVTLTATADSNSVFLGWLGLPDGVQNPIDFIITQNKCAKPLFGTVVTTAAVGDGEVLREPELETLPYESSVRLTAIPRTGSYFSHWNENPSDSNSVALLTIINPKPTFVAHFETLPAGEVTLAVRESGFGTVVVSPPQQHYAMGQLVTVQAVPFSGQRFLGWTGDVVGPDNPVILELDQSRSVVAHFTESPAFAVGPCLFDLSPSGCLLTLKGGAGSIYRLDATADFAVWSPLGNVTNVVGIVQVIDGVATNYSARFYRAVQLVP